MVCIDYSPIHGIIPSMHLLYFYSGVVRWTRWSVLMTDCQF